MVLAVAGVGVGFGQINNVCLFRWQHPQRALFVIVIRFPRFVIHRDDDR